MSLKKVTFMTKPETIEKYKKIAEEKNCNTSILYRDALDFYLSFKYSKDSKDELHLLIDNIVSRKFAKFEKRIFSLLIKIIVTVKTSEELGLYVLEKVIGYKMDNEQKKQEIENMVIAKIKSKNPNFMNY